MHAFGVYGHLAGLTEEELRACMTLLGGYECEIQDDSPRRYTYSRSTVPLARLSPMSRLS